MRRYDFREKNNLTEGGIMSGQELSPAHTVRKMALGYIISRSISVVAELRIADLLKDGTKTAEELANTTGTNENILYRILRILAGEGVFKEETDRSFSLTPLSQALRTDVADSVHAYIVMKHELEFPPLMDIMHTVCTGEPAFVETFGKPAFEYLKENSDSAARFHAAMSAGHGNEDDVLAEAFDFSGVKHVVDVGGGDGSLLSAILKCHDHITGTLLEMEPAVAAARSGAGGPLPRCELIAGNFLEEVTPGGDVYVLKKIVHNWDEEQAITILRNCRNAMNAGGKVLIIETLVGSANESTWGKMQDFTMLLIFEGGMERTIEEYAVLLAKAGLKLDRVQDISPETAIVIAEAA
jgi:O-methyltransferase domain